MIVYHEHRWSTINMLFILNMDDSVGFVAISFDIAVLALLKKQLILIVIRPLDDGPLKTISICLPPIMERKAGDRWWTHLTASLRFQHNFIHFIVEGFSS